MELYRTTCLKCSKLITQSYSTSFTLGIKTLSRKFRMPIYGIYGFVRYADEIVDTFHNFDKQYLLEKFKADTYEAIESGISLNPVLHAFQYVVNTYHIEKELIEAFLSSMEMDLYKDRYTDASYNEYIYGSAEVVGLMCLRVFCEGDKEQYESLKEPAQSLGRAFQKVNFLRDMKSDFQERGRVYFPGVNFLGFNNDAKQIIEADIQQDFDDALKGIIRLPEGARQGVHLAYVYYLKLFRKIRRAPADQILEERIRIPDPKKIALLLKTYFQYQLNFL